MKEDQEPARHCAQKQEKKKENRPHSRLLPILMHEEVLHLDQRNKQVSTKVGCEM